MAENTLICFDTDRIKEYVFATDKLREVRGASLLLNELNQADLLRERLSASGLTGEIGVCAGGAAIIVTPEKKQAPRIVSTIENLYRERTFSASISGAILPYQPELDNFGERMSLAGLLLRQAKDEKAQRSQAGLQPYAQPCQSCGMYPASRTSEIDQATICVACDLKRKAFTAHRAADPSKPDDLEILGDAARPSGYIGFIYADGNHMGDLFRHFSKLEQYAEFSKRLNGLVLDSVQKTLGSWSDRKVKDQSIHPYEQLLVGGDDLIIVTAGDLALPTCLELSRRFSENMASLFIGLADTPDPLPTFSLAVVLAHASFPIAAFHDLVSQLLRRAKQRCTEGGYREDSIDFMVVTSAGSNELKTIREEVLTERSFVFPHGDRKVHLTQRPYQSSELELLIKHIHEFKKANFPRSQLQFLYEGLFHSQVEAVFRWSQTMGHIKKEQADALKAFYDDFGDRPAGLAPWKRSTGSSQAEYTSALGDLIEIYPFIQDQG